MFGGLRVCSSHIFPMYVCGEIEGERGIQRLTQFLLFLETFCYVARHTNTIHSPDIILSQNVGISVYFQKMFLPKLCDLQFLNYKPLSDRKSDLLSIHLNAFFG